MSGSVTSESELFIELGDLAVTASSKKYGRVGDLPLGLSEPVKWRVWVHTPGGPLGFRMGFVRRKDAEMAMAALERHGFTTYDALIVHPQPDEFNRIMAEALQW